MKQHKKLIKSFKLWVQGIRVVMACGEALQAKLKGTAALFAKYNPIKCPISMLKGINQVSLKFENVTFKAFAIYDAKKALSNFYQTKQGSLLHEYFVKFKDLTDALEHYGAKIGTTLVSSRMQQSKTIIKKHILLYPGMQSIPSTG
jgi:hypothetical protein